MGAFTKIFQRLKLTSDSNVATQTTSVIQADTTNSSIAIVPNGTGAIIASVPDGTATGGNARGQYAVDLQMARGLSTQVASQNYSGILSGANNIISAASDTTYSVISGGLSNSSARPYTFIGGGSSNSIVNSGGNGERSVIGGGGSNTITGASYSTISGGQSNTASTNTHATVVGGYQNTASGQYSISGGRSCIANGNRSIAFNDGSQASGIGTASFNSSYANGNYSTTFGANTTVNSLYSLGMGIYANGYLYNSFIHGSSDNTTGNRQYSNLISYKDSSLTTAATTVLSLDGTGTTNLIIPNGNNRAWNVQIDTIAVVTAITGTATGVSVGDCYMEKACLLFKRVGGTSSIVGSPDVTSIKSDASMATAGIDINAGSSQQLEIVFNAPSFSGGGSVTFRIVSKVSLVEVAY